MWRLQSVNFTYAFHRAELVGESTSTPNGAIPFTVHVRCFLQWRLSTCFGPVDIPPVGRAFREFGTNQISRPGLDCRLYRLISQYNQCSRSPWCVHLYDNFFPVFVDSLPTQTMPGIATGTIVPQ